MHSLIWITLFVPSSDAFRVFGDARGVVNMANILMAGELVEGQVVRSRLL